MSEIETLTAEYREHLGDVAPGAIEIIDAQTKRIAELDADYEKSRKELWAQTKKQQGRIAELEALVLSADTVSKVEYAAMVQQRDTMREDLKAARHLLTDAHGLLKSHANEDIGFDEWLEGQEFYELMQAYRVTPILQQTEASRRFEEIKARLCEFSFESPGSGPLIRAIEALPPFRA